MSGCSSWRTLAFAATLAGASLAAGQTLAREYFEELPPGPYRQECRRERIEGGYMLMATCPRRNGEMREAALDLRTCPRNMVVHNEGANLRCHSAGGYNSGERTRGEGWREGRGYDLPGGPYRRDCRNERVVDGYMLMATCPKANGDMRDASLDLRTCPRGASIHNEGAYLRCR